MLYVGNLGEDFSEEELYTLFSQCGNVLRIIPGFNKKQGNTLCGFAFVQMATHAEASFCCNLLNRMTLKGSQLRCDWDTGDGILGARRFGRAVDGRQQREHKHNKLPYHT